MEMRVPSERDENLSSIPKYPWKFGWKKSSIKPLHPWYGTLMDEVWLNGCMIFSQNFHLAACFPVCHSSTFTFASALTLGEPRVLLSVDLNRFQHRSVSSITISTEGVLSCSQGVHKSRMLNFRLQISTVFSWIYLKLCPKQPKSITDMMDEDQQGGNTINIFQMTSWCTFFPWTPQIHRASTPRFWKCSASRPLPFASSVLHPEGVRKTHAWTMNKHRQTMGRRNGYKRSHFSQVCVAKGRHAV